MTAWISRKIIVNICLEALLCISVLLCFRPASAERASLVFNPDTGTVLHAKSVRLRSFPASLTKLMTLYLLFEALDSKQLKLGDKVLVSAEAGRQPPSRLGLKQGGQITIEEVLLALIVKSANDVAVVAAERMSGSESDFVRMMNARAEALGMSDTVFGNASGLPDRRQTTTALDIAVLAQKLMIKYPQYYPFLSRHSFQYHGKTFERKNSFMNSSESVNKLKTGFTCQAGYNLVASVERDSQRLIGVILGAPNAGQRNALMAKLFSQAVTRQNTAERALTLKSLRDASGQGLDGAVNARAIADSCIVRSPTALYEQITGWGLLVGADKSAQQALNLASKTIRRFPKLLKGARPTAIPFLRKVLLYRSYLTGLKEAAAVDTCSQMRYRGYYCVTENPAKLRIRLDEGRVALKRAQDLRSDKSTGS